MQQRNDSGLRINFFETLQFYFKLHDFNVLSLGKHGYKHLKLIVNFQLQMQLDFGHISSKDVACVKSLPH